MVFHHQIFNFVLYFLQKGKTYEELKAELGEANMGVAAIDINGTAGQEKSFSQIAKYPYSELVKPPEELPEGVDATQREVGFQLKLIKLFNQLGLLLYYM